MTLQHFLTMGGYAQYVWPAFGLVATGLLVSAVAPWRAHKHLFKGKPQ